jgi:ferredoxin-thioredoxin reductase catalytic subunit
MKNTSVGDEEVQILYEKLKNEAETSGYHLNPDIESAKYLVKSLIVNEKRYGYWACPCRLASGNKDEDLDIICPCDYRDADLDEHDSCYCALYVSEGIAKGKKEAGPIPERRAPREEERNPRAKSPSRKPDSLSQPVWRCRVCGYLCARDGPPERCPICKAEKERFERFM